MSSELIFAGGGRVSPLTVVRRPGARTLRLSVDPRDASVRLTLPRRAALRPALSWAAGKRGWVEGELAKLPVARPIEPGTRFTLAGREVVVDWNTAYPRRVALVDDRLQVGGERSSLSARVLRFLRREALRKLDADTRTLAAAHGLKVARVGVGDPRARWGSCSASGDVRYSWRLILAPPEVMRATVAHEVAHLRHLDHSPAFHALHRTLLGEDPAPPRAWLRAHGVTLQWFGRAA